LWFVGGCKKLNYEKIHHFAIKYFYL